MLREVVWTRRGWKHRLVLQEGRTQTALPFPAFEVILYLSGHRRLPDMQMLIRGGMINRTLADTVFDRYLITHNVV